MKSFARIAMLGVLFLGIGLVLPLMAQDEAPPKLTAEQEQALKELQDMDSNGGALGYIMEESSKFYDWIITMTKPTAGKSLVVSDKDTEVEFSFPNENQNLRGADTIGVKITNKTGKAITVNWDNSALFSLDGSKRRLLASGVTMPNWDKPQAPRTIAAGQSLADNLTPRDGAVVRVVPAHWNEAGDTWIDKETKVYWNYLFLDLRQNYGEGLHDEYDKVKALVVGKNFSVSIALTVGGAPKVVTGSFRINDITLTKDKSKGLQIPGQ